MTFRKTIILCSLTLATACGAHPRPAPNDEVSTPMNADDEASLDKGSLDKGAGTQDPDAGPAGN